MPEGPECKVIADQLNIVAQGKQLTGIQIIGGRYANVDPDGFWKSPYEHLPLKVIEVTCKGKFIYWRLDRQHSIWNTLGMTGSWSKEKTKHSAIAIEIDGQPIYFNDPRHFGTIRFCQSDDELTAKLKTIGPDMLSHPPSKVEFRRIMERRNVTLAEALMDQKVISGVGNYVKAESLYLAKLSPWRRCNSLNMHEAYALHAAIIKVLQKSYSAGGATLATYRHLDGSIGRFSDQLIVYKKNTDPNGNEIIREDTADKRATWWCPAVQI